MKQQITEEFIAYILNHVRTWLDELPEWVKNDKGHEIDLSVKNEEGLDLRFCASLPNTATALPRFAYLFNNTRIRGLDFHFQYIDYQKNKQCGWHEHIWNDATQFPERHQNVDVDHIKELERRVDYVLKRWKIEYREQYQLEFKDK